MKDKAEYLEMIDCPRCNRRGKLYIHYRVGKKGIQFHAFYSHHGNHSCYLGKKVRYN